MPVKFFWERWHRGVQMGGKYELEAMEWVDAYKQALSNSKKNDFDKEWDKLEKANQAFVNGNKGAQPTCW